jgi:hypothetical protein
MYTLLENINVLFENMKKLIFIWRAPDGIARTLVCEYLI